MLRIMCVTYIATSIISYSICVFGCVQVLFEANRALQCQAELCQAGSFCERSSALVESEPKWTTIVPIQYALHPTRVRHVAYQWGMVQVCVQALIVTRYGSLWHALDHITQRSTVARFQTVRYRYGSLWECSSAPLVRHGKSTAQVQHILGERLKSPFVSNLANTGL